MACVGYTEVVNKGTKVMSKNSGIAIDFSHVDHLADFLLGTRKDAPKPIYTPVEVKSPNDFSPVCVVINDECNHADTKTEEVEQTMFNPDHSDAIWYQEVETCKGCGAWRLPREEWNYE